MISPGVHFHLLHVDLDLFLKEEIMQELYRFFNHVIDIIEFLDVFRRPCEIHNIGEYLLKAFRFL